MNEEYTKQKPSRAKKIYSNRIQDNIPIECYNPNSEVIVELKLNEEITQQTAKLTPIGLRKL